MQKKQSEACTSRKSSSSIDTFIDPVLVIEGAEEDAKKPSEACASRRSSSSIGNSIGPVLINEIMEGVEEDAFKPSEAYISCKISIDNIDHTLIEDSIRGAGEPASKLSETHASRSSIGIIDPTIIDDIIQCARKGGHEVSTAMVLREMVQGKSQHPLPDWLDDLFGAPLESIDTDVLKELLLATVGDGRSRDSTKNGSLESGTSSDKDPMARSQQDSAAPYERKSSILDQKQPYRHDVQQNYETEENKRPLAVAHDTRGPIPPEIDILGASFTSMVEPETVSRVVEDTRGPVPNDDFMYCTISLASEKKEGSVSSASRKNQKEESNGSLSCASNTDHTAGSASRNHVKKESIGSSSTDAKNESGDIRCAPNSDAKGASSASLSYGSQKKSGRGSVWRGSIHSSSHSVKGDSDTASTSKISCSSCSTSSDRKPPPSMNLSPQSTIQSSPDHSHYTRTQSTMEYPSDEDPARGMMPPPPPLPCMSSSTSFSSFDDDDDDQNLNVSHAAHTKPSLGFLARRSRHVHPCNGSDDEIQVAATKMRQLVLDSLRARQRVEMIQRERRLVNKQLRPINI